MPLPKIGITLGDPGGIGPEVILKALAGKEKLPKAHYILFGPGNFIQSEIERLDLALSFSSSFLSLVDMPENFSLEKRGEPQAVNGQVSFLCVETAVKKARENVVQAVVTGPISKESWQLAGVPYPGHTAYLNRSFPRAIMSFFSSRLNVALFTHHLPLKKALDRIRRDDLEVFLAALKKSTHKLGRFQFLMAGLNPHAGERGMLGNEEINEIIPAVERAQADGMNIKGPFAPDTVFLKALDQPDKIVISLYHDQGLVAFKLIAFDTGVNVTLGLPFVRTSPDHGTAFDIAGTGRADPGSMREALRLAADFSSRMLDTEGIHHKKGENR